VISIVGCLESQVVKGGSQESREVEGCQESQESLYAVNDKTKPT
jgi:hypothetical protein